MLTASSLVLLFLTARSGPEQGGEAGHTAVDPTAEVRVILLVIILVLMSLLCSGDAVARMLIGVNLLIK